MKTIKPRLYAQIYKHEQLQGIDGMLMPGHGGGVSTKQCSVAYMTLP